MYWERTSIESCYRPLNKNYKRKPSAGAGAGAGEISLRFLITKTSNKSGFTTPEAKHKREAMLKAIKSKMSDFFSPPECDVLSTATIWSWWEGRRLAYNIMMFVVALSSFAAYLILWTTSGLLYASDDVIEPLLIPILAIGMPIAWNLCFCLGAITHSLVPKSHIELRKKAGPGLLKSGLAFSLMVLALPTVDAACAWFYQLPRGFAPDANMHNKIKGL